MLFVPHGTGDCQIQVIGPGGKSEKSGQAQERDGIQTATTVSILTSATLEREAEEIGLAAVT